MTSKIEFENNLHLDRVAAAEFKEHAHNFGSGLNVKSKYFQQELLDLIKHAKELNASINAAKKNHAQIKKQGFFFLDENCNASAIPPGAYSN